MAADRKKWILEAASKSFALFGYKATTMEQVAKIAGVGKGTIYTFFSTKEELFDAIMMDVILEMKRIADKVIQEEPTFFQKLERVLEELFRYRNNHELLIRLSHEINEMGTAKAQEGMKSLEGAILGFLEKNVRIAIERGDIRPCDPQVAAFVIMNMYVSFVYDWGRTHSDLTKEQISEYFRVYLFEGLAVH